jgi:hypothetical protein
MYLGIHVFKICSIIYKEYRKQFYIYDTKKKQSILPQWNFMIHNIPFI